MNRESIISKARGAYELSQEGATEGERAAAQAALDRILAKYDLTLNDIRPQERYDWYRFTYTTYYEKRLLGQILDMVTKGREERWLDADDGGVEVRLTPDELEEMGRLYEAYAAMWRETVELVWVAFLRKHRLYCNKDADDSTDTSLDEWRKIMGFMRLLNDAHVPLPLGRRLGRKGGRREP